MADDAQTHALPRIGRARARLAASMGYADWTPFAAALECHRAPRHARISTRSCSGRGGGARAHAGRRRSSRSGSAEPALERVAEDVAASGSPNAERRRGVLFELRQSAYFRRLDEFGRRRLATLVPRILAAVASGRRRKRALPAVLARLLRIVEAIGGRTAYLALLNENAQALERLVEVCRMGDYLARQVAAHPLLLDELLDARVFETLPDRAQFARELAARLEHAGDDEEQRMDALRHFRRAAMFRVATAGPHRPAAAHAGERPADGRRGAGPRAGAGARLAAHGRAIRRAALRGRGGPRAARVGIAGYGKLGGMELGYASDLDLVFLHDSAGERAADHGAEGRWTTRSSSCASRSASCTC